MCVAADAPTEGESTSLGKNVIHINRTSSSKETEELEREQKKKTTGREEAGGNKLNERQNTS